MNINIAPLNATALAAVVAKAERGVAIIYHEGLLMRERQLDPAVEARAVVAWKAHTDGIVSLVQMRNVRKSCTYLMVKR